MNKDGTAVVLDEDGILQTWQEGRTDNVDVNNSLSLYVFLPTSTISVRMAQLQFKLLPFRSYSRATAGGGSATVTSAGGGNTTITSASGGGDVKSTLSEDYRSDYGHNHGIADGTRLAVYPVSSGAYVTFTESAAHTHRVEIPNHTHKIEIPSHTHEVVLPSHTHDIEHGIYTSTTATGVKIIVNNIQVGNTYYNDLTDFDIAQFLEIGKWNEIKLTSTRLGRIDASVFIQAFMGT